MTDGVAIQPVDPDKNQLNSKSQFRCSKVSRDNRSSLAIYPFAYRK